MAILGLAILDLFLFPFRCVLFFFRQGRHRSEILPSLAETPPPLSPPPPANKPKQGRPAKIFLSVGDISAEPHAVRLIQELRTRRTNLEFLGFGGRKMEEAGCRILFNPIELALFGFSGPAKQIPAHLKALRRFQELLKTDPPDLLVLLDYPGFNLYLARAAKRKVPVVYYICPQVWAWAPWRLRGLQRDLSQALSILPFEASFFAKKGIPAHFVGHPIADHLAESDRQSSRAAEKAPLLALLPGSRRKEVDLNLPAMLRVAEKLREKFPELRCAIPHEREDRIAQIRAIAVKARIPVEIRPGRLHETLRESRLVFAKSGTAVLEVAHYEAPMIVFYKFADGISGRIWEWIARNFLITPYFTSINLLANRKVVPEFAYESRRTEENILRVAEQLWRDGPERQECVEGIRAAKSRFDVPGTASRAAERILEKIPD